MGNDNDKSNELPAVVDREDAHADPAEASDEILAEAADVVAEAARPWRAAETLLALREQINRAFPTRSKASDGIIGDAAHASRSSDHNPWVIDGSKGVVTAMDITHDPRSGCDANKVVAALHAGRDRRIKYLIWNRRIANSSAIGGVPAWTWRSYSGRNPHDHHFHLSVKPDKTLYDNRDPWHLDGITEAAFAAEAEEGIDRDVNAALMAMGDAAGADAPALPRLVALQDALTQLFANYAQEWYPATESVEAEAAPPFATLKPKYESLFASAQVRTDRKPVVAWHVAMLKRGRARYEAVQAATGAPWWFVGIVHAMEAAFSFNGHLHNGDPLTARTVQVPRNRPPAWNPPSDWLSSAVDAITFQGHANQQDWSLARALYRFEGYNGYGYYAKDIPSPYLWSFSNHYTKGKFVRDHQYDANFVSKQCGAAVMLRALIDANVVGLPD